MNPVIVALIFGFSAQSLKIDQDGSSVVVNIKNTTSVKYTVM